MAFGRIRYVEITCWRNLHYNTFWPILALRLLKKLLLLDVIDRSDIMAKKRN